MLTKETIDELKSSHVVKELCGRLEAERAAAIAIPNNHSIQSIEEFGMLRQRERGTMTTGHIVDFTNYINAINENYETKLFAQSQTMSATAYFNLGDKDHPGHGDYKAKLSLDETPLFKALQEIDGKGQSQKQTAEWLEDWRSHITASTTDGDIIDIRAAIKAVRSMTIEQGRTSEHTIGNMSASKGTMESIEASSKTDDLPAYFTVTCHPYHGFEQRDITTELSVLTSEDSPKLKLRIIQKEQIMQELGEEMNTKITDGLTDKAIPIYNGSFSP